MKFVQKQPVLPFIIFSLLASIVFITYHGVFSTFFQQDEWQTTGYFIVKGIHFLYDTELGQNPLGLLLAEGRIFSGFMYFVLYSVKRFSVMPIFIFSLLFHSINAFLIYLTARKISRSFIVGFIASLFFAVNNVGSEAVTWAAAVGTIPATTLLVVSLFWYVDFLETDNKRKKIGAFITGILSLFFKETGLFIFLFYPLLYLFWRKSKGIKDILVTHAPLLLYGGVLVIFRIAKIFFMPVGYAGFVDNQKGEFIFSVLYQSIVYPLTSFIQVFIVPMDMYGFVPRVVRSMYPYFVGTPLFDLAGQSAVADAVSLVGTILVLAILSIMVFGKKEKKINKRIVVLGFLFFFLSFLPYAVLHRFFSYFSSRYYYVGVVGAALLFGYAVSWISSRLSRLLRIIFFVAVGFYFLYHAEATQQDLRVQITRANERKTFLQEIKKVHPILQNRTVFYITSDKKYLGEITYPFQSGLGYILEVWYYDSGKIPKAFLHDNFLWDLGEEGYRSTGASSFGYFERLDKLGEFVKEGKITPDIVYGYVYNSQTHIFLDVTALVRQQLATLSGQLR